MLKKLIKYEWKGLIFPFVIMLIVLAGTTLLTCAVLLTINPKYDESVQVYSAMALMLSIFLYYFGMIGCTLGTTLIIAIRFYKTCYTDQGYLTHTLPVTTHQILIAKIAIAFFVNILMALAILFSVFIIIQVGILHITSFYTDSPELKWIFKDMFSIVLDEFANVFGIHLPSFLIYMILYSIISEIANVVIIFGCISLGQLYAKHRILGAIASYFIVLFIEQIFGWFTSVPISARVLSTKYTTVFDILSPTMNLSLLFIVMLAVFMYFANIHMMTKKLNLE